MKKEYKELFDSVTPSKDLENKVIRSAEKKKRILFSPKKIIAVAAAFAIVVVGGFGVYRASSDHVTDPGSYSSSRSASDFSIVAYAQDSDDEIKTISDDDIELMNLKISLNESQEGYYVNSHSDDDGLSVRSDDDIESVIFESENGSFSYLDSPLRNYLISQKKYYSAVIPITQEQYEEYNNMIANTNGEGTADLKQQFVSELINSTDCSQYIYDDDFDVSKISTYEYSVYSSDMADAEVNYYDYCILIIDKNKNRLYKDYQNSLVAKTYQPGDKIEYVYYNPDEATEYLLNHPDADFSKLPTDHIKITVKFKNGQSVTKEIVTSFSSDGTLKMKYK